MSYIPHSIINKLKSLSILDVAERLGIQINSKGYSLCFMHNEKIQVYTSIKKIINFTAMDALKVVMSSNL